jgi:hypothetical protein
MHADQIIAAAIGMIEKSLRREQRAAHAVDKREQGRPLRQRRIGRQAIPPQGAVEQRRDDDA